MGYKIDNRPLATIEPGWCDKCGETSWSRVMECQESSPGACRWIRGEPPCRYCGGTGHFYSDPELGPCGCSATAETGSISGPLAGFVTPEAPEPVPEAPRPPTVENPGFLIHPAPEDRSPISSQPAKRVEEDATHVLF